MKFFRLDLLTLLISLFILNSCKNQDTIGLNKNSTSLLTDSLIDTTTVYTNTTRDDSVITSGLAKSPMGYLVDPVFGTTEADLVTDLNLPFAVAYTKPTGTITVDSAILILKYADGFYGDLSKKTAYTVNVYQLDKERLNSQAYYNNKIWSYNPTVRGSLLFNLHTNDSLIIKTIVPGGIDTLVKVAPQLRIPINTDFINTILFNAPAPQLASNLVFKNNVKGFFINIDKTKLGSSPGGTFMFKAPGDSSLAVYIRVKNGSTVDTSIVYLSMRQYTSEIRHSYSQEVTDAIRKDSLNVVNHTHVSDGQVYLQGLASTRARISFPYIQKLFSAPSIGGSQNVIVNRAELVLTVKPGSNIPTYLKPQPRLTLYRFDAAHQRVSVEDAGSDNRNLGVAAFGGFLDSTSTSKSYHFLVTAYMQDLVSGRTTDYGTFIAPIDTTNITSVDIAATPQTGGRVVGLGGGGNDKTNPYRLKLNVIYTKITKKK